MTRRTEKLVTKRKLDHHIPMNNDSESDKVNCCNPPDRLATLLLSWALVSLLTEGEIGDISRCHCCVTCIGCDIFSSVTSLASHVARVQQSRHSEWELSVNGNHHCIKSSRKHAIKSVSALSLSSNFFFPFIFSRARKSFSLRKLQLKSLSSLLSPRLRLLCSSGRRIS
jgi:hypothetical protein